MGREDALADLRRVQRQGRPAVAVLVWLQGLAASRRARALFHFLRNGLQELVERTGGRLHALGEARFLLVLEAPGELVERQLAVLFDVERAGPGDPDRWRRFCEVFRLPDLYVALRERMDELERGPGEDAEEGAEALPAGSGEEAEPLAGEHGASLTGELRAENLATLLSFLDGADLAPLLRRQGVYRLAERPQVLYDELFLPLEDMLRATCPGLWVSPTSPLGLEVRRHLDRLLLAQLLIDRPFDHAAIGINLSMAAVASPEFGWLVERTRRERRAQLVIELDWLEVLADLTRDGGVCAELRNAGFRLAVDGLTPEALRWITPDWLAFPVVKIRFSEETAALFADPGLLARVAALPAETVVLSRCDSRAALSAARRLGVRHVQGWLIDRFVRQSAVPIREPTEP